MAGPEAVDVDVFSAGGWSAISLKPANSTRAALNFLTRFLPDRHLIDEDSHAAKTDDDDAMIDTTAATIG